MRSLKFFLIFIINFWALGDDNLMTPVGHHQIWSDPESPISLILEPKIIPSNVRKYSEELLKYRCADDKFNLYLLYVISEHKNVDITNENNHAVTTGNLDDAYMIGLKATFPDGSSSTQLYRINNECPNLTERSLNIFRKRVFEGSRVKNGGFKRKRKRVMPLCL